MADYDVAIIGAGIAGASLAAEVGPHHRVLLLEAEDLPGYHTTGRSAAFWEECYVGPEIVPLTRASEDFLRAGGFLAPRGALYVGRKEDAAALDAFEARFVETGAHLERLAPGQAQQQVPLLRPEWCEAIWQPQCADIDVAALHQHYLRAAKAAGVVLVTRARIETVERDGEGWLLRSADGREWRAEAIANAAGAWADTLAEMAGARSLGHPAVIEWRRNLERFAPPAAGMVLLLLPCSARKPYHWSATHRRFHRTLRELDNWLALHVVSVTSPLGLVPRELEMLHPAAHYDVGVTGHWDANEAAMFGRQLERLRPEDRYKKAIVHAGSASGLLAELLRERGVEVLETGAERPASGAGLGALRTACRPALRGGASRSGRDRSRGEAAGLAQVQFDELAEPLLAAAVQGRWPRLRLEGVANFSPRIGGFALTVQGAAALAAAGGPVIEAAEFQLRGDLFAAGVIGTRGEFRNGEQVAVEQGGEITAAGVARMAPGEMVAMERGLAVEVRNRG